MSVYLHDIPLPEAQARLKQALQDADLWRVLGMETIPLDENALGRVTAEPIWAKISSPHYHASAMDGFAVRAITTNGAIALQTCHASRSDPRPSTWIPAIRCPIGRTRSSRLRMSKSLDEDGNITTEIRNADFHSYPCFCRAVESCPPVGRGYCRDTTGLACRAYFEAGGSGSHRRVGTSGNQSGAETKGCDPANRNRTCSRLAASSKQGIFSNTTRWSSRHRSNPWVVNQRVTRSQKMISI